MYCSNAFASSAKALSYPLLNTMTFMQLRPRLMFVIMLTSTILSGALVPGCSDMDRNPESGPASAFTVRRFSAPGQIAQSLDKGGRALVFLELTDAEYGTPLEVDPAWTFEISIAGPTGSSVPLTPEPVVPRAWRDDAGVQLVGGFKASTRGIYQITISSENCPPRKAQMVLLPIN